MYPAGAAGAQAAPQGPAGPTASPAYSSYQPTPTQGYQVGGWGRPHSRGEGPQPSSHHALPSTERGVPGCTEPPGRVPASAVGCHGLHGEPVGVPGLPALQHAGERPGSVGGRAFCSPPPSPPLGSPSWWAFEFSGKKSPPFIAVGAPYCGVHFVFTEPHEHPSQSGHANAAPAAALHLRAAAHVPAGEPLPRLPLRLWTPRTLGPPWEGQTVQASTAPQQRGCVHTPHAPAAPTDPQATRLLSAQGRVSSAPQTSVGSSRGLCWGWGDNREPATRRKQRGGGLAGAETRTVGASEGGRRDQRFLCVPPRWRPPGDPRSSRPPWPSSRPHRALRHRAAKPSSSPSTDRRLGAGHPEQHYGLANHRLRL